MGKCICEDCRGVQIPSGVNNVKIDSDWTKPLVGFTGLSCSNFDMKILEDGIIPLSVGLSTNGVDVDPHGESITFEEEGLYKIHLDVAITDMHDKISISMNMNLDGIIERLTLMSATSIGEQSTNTIVKIESGTSMTLTQRGNSEVTYKAGSVKIQVYKIS